MALVFERLDKLGIRPDPGGKFLDFGCGVGRISRVLMQHFSEGFGIDVSETMIEKAKAFSASDPGQARYIKIPRRSRPDRLRQDRFRLFPHRASARAGSLPEQVHRGVHSHPEARRRCRVPNPDRERRKRGAEKDSRDQEDVASDIAVCPAHARQTGPGQGCIRRRRVDGHECLPRDRRARHHCSKQMRAARGALHEFDGQEPRRPHQVYVARRCVGGNRLRGNRQPLSQPVLLCAEIADRQLPNRAETTSGSMVREESSDTMPKPP